MGDDGAPARDKRALVVLRNQGNLVVLHHPRVTKPAGFRSPDGTWKVAGAGTVLQPVISERSIFESGVRP
jgi:hypothetical protein